jgi:hypothetical protein
VHKYLLILISLCNLSFAYPFDTDLKGQQSQYTELILQLKNHWPPPDINYETVPKDSVQIECLETKDKKLYIGAEQVMWIDASLNRVVNVLDDVDSYQKIFSGYKEIKINKKDENKWDTYWEQIIPIFFISNIKYNMIYLIDKSEPKKAYYRYQLKQKADLNAVDGIIIVEEIAAKTRYTEYDFVDADNGILAKLATATVWKDTIESLYLADLGLKYRVEHPDWEFTKVVSEAKKRLEKKPVDAVLSKRKSFFLLPK